MRKFKKNPGRYALKILFILSTFSNAAIALDLTANVGLAYREYPHEETFAGQSDGGISFTFQGELRKKWNDGNSVLTFLPFYRKDDMDDERTHGDIRQFDLVHSTANWEYQLGIGKVFWGVAESSHLVDVINQTDAIESLDGEEKLGQPLVRAGRFFDGGMINFFILPYFRERTFAGEDGRLRFSMVVNTDNAGYESAQKEKHVDYAVRMQKQIESIDVGLSYFDGTSRTPILIPDFVAGELNPYYPLVKQTGLDMQYTGDKWIWKLEAIYRDLLRDNYFAEVGGFEYTIPGVANTNVELGIIAEYHYDSRGDVMDAPFQDDIFVGTRLVFNDLDAECLIGGYYDRENYSRSYLVEFTMRMSNHLQLNIEAQAFSSIHPADTFYDFRNDDFFEVELKYFF